MFEKHKSLRALNTFGIEAYAENYLRVENLSVLQEVTKEHKDVFVLGGGSNILLTKDISKPVIHMVNKGIEPLQQGSKTNKVLVRAQAGEIWHDFVLWCLSRNLGGLENLSLIPGHVGASPMQNIGAYGVEVKDRFHELEALEIETGRIRRFSASECGFGYRESVFKNVEKGKYIILHVTFELSTRDHEIHTDYGAIRSELDNRGIQNPSIRDVSDVVIDIRRSKLPDPAEIGNSGSFFKNPVISRSQYEALSREYRELPHYPVSEEAVKVPAGWLVEKSGYKGYRVGDAGVHRNQALVLVNYERATGREILELAKEIQATVLNRFDIALEMEVNVI